MKPRRVVIVTFPGMQPLDAVGPFEVFAGASRAAAALAGRRPGGYGVEPSSTHGGEVRGDSGLGLCTAPFPGPGTPIDTLVVWVETAPSRRAGTRRS